MGNSVNMRAKQATVLLGCFLGLLALVPHANSCFPGGGGGGGPSPTPPPTGGGNNGGRCKCGLNTVRIGSKVVGGQNANKGEVGWQVGLSSSSSSSNARIFCGGTLLNDRWVLSAAHCGTRTAYAWIGMIDRRNPTRDGQVIRTRRRINHPQYNNGSPPNYDFQLIELSSAVNFADSRLSHVYPACWPTSEPTSGRVVISGWGTTSSGGSQPNILQKANVEVIAIGTCNNLSAYRNRITNQMVCMGRLAGGVDTCQGDSGGPAVTQNGNNWEVTGVTSWGSGCASRNAPGVYANTFAVRSWIASTAGSECTRS